MGLENLLSAVGGPLLGAAGSLIGGQMANQQSAASAQKQMDFQERMADTQYQRTVADMKAAGLNPMLAAFSGSVNASPGGSSYTAQNPAAGMVSAGQAVADSMKIPSQISQINAQTQLMESQRLSETTLQDLRAAQMELTDAQTKVQSASAKGINSENVAKAALANVWRNHPKVMAALQILAGQSSNISTAAGLAKSFGKLSD